MLPARLSDAELAAAFDLFRGPTADGLGAEDVALALTACGAMGVTEADAKALVGRCRGGVMSREEFVAAAGLLRCPSECSSAAAMDVAFRYFDRGGAGMLSAAGLREATNALFGRPAPPRVISEVIRWADSDGDGLLSKAEFTDAVNFVPRPVPPAADDHFVSGAARGSNVVTGRRRGHAMARRKTVLHALKVSHEHREHSEVDAAAAVAAATSGAAGPTAEHMGALGDWLVAEWHSKTGSVVDELVQNLSAPEDHDAETKFQTIALAAQHIALSASRYSDFSWAELMVMRLYTMAGPDIDALMGYGDVPDYEVQRDAWHSYGREQTPRRNGAIFSAVNAALRSAPHPPPPVPCPAGHPDDSAQHQLLRRWVKFCILIFSLAVEGCGEGVSPDAEVARGLAGLPDAVPAAHRALRPGEQLRWPAPSSCTMRRAVSEQYVRGEAANATRSAHQGAVLFIVTGLSCGLPLQDISQYPAEEELLLPPLLELTVEEVGSSGLMGCDVPDGTVVLRLRQCAAEHGAAPLQGLCFAARRDGRAAGAALQAEWDGIRIASLSPPTFGLRLGDLPPPQSPTQWAGSPRSPRSSSGQGRPTSPRGARSPTAGALVREVVAGGPSEGQLRAGDVIVGVQVDGGDGAEWVPVRQLADFDAFRTGLQPQPRGFAPVLLKVSRGAAGARSPTRVAIRRVVPSAGRKGRSSRGSQGASRTPSPRRRPQSPRSPSPRRSGAPRRAPSPRARSGPRPPRQPAGATPQRPPSTAASRRGTSSPAGSFRHSLPSPTPLRRSVLSHSRTPPPAPGSATGRSAPRPGTPSTPGAARGGGAARSSAAGSPVASRRGGSRGTQRRPAPRSSATAPAGAPPPPAPRPGQPGPEGSRRAAGPSSPLSSRRSGSRSGTAPLRRPLPHG
eukprot:TRINITY_DN12496_c0_g1_i2.p1 TRINITY_DN12496_c0_g1~~TRINITY_DN12496_c0_g1_i2.p1  ORF type:complete len:903 (+),score=164.53 TRINITY_DN12496_c0_g1_i2:82-2790(+)